MNVAVIVATLSAVLCIDASGLVHTDRLRLRLRLRLFYSH